MKTLTQHIQEALKVGAKSKINYAKFPIKDNDKLFGDEDMRLHCVDVPELTELIINNFGKFITSAGRCDGWIAFDGIGADDNYEAPSKYKFDEDQQDDFYEFMFRLMPYFENVDDISPEDVIDEYNYLDDKFKNAVKDWILKHVHKM